MHSTKKHEISAYTDINKVLRKYIKYSKTDVTRLFK